MNSFALFFVASLLMIIGVYYFRNPKKFQERDIKRVNFYKFLRRSKYTAWIYNDMLERASSDESLYNAKLVSVIFIFMGLVLFLVLFLRMFSSVN